MSWLLTLLVPSAFAYIPEYATIAARAAEQHGRGGYQVEQEVTYKKEAESFSVKEIWQVQSENEMRLTLEGRGPLRGLVSGTIVYGPAAKSFAEPGLSARSQRLGDEWLEPFFHFRSPKWFRNRLVTLKVTPPEALQDRAPLAAEGDPEYAPPSFLRLSRAGGAVTWAIGIPPGVGTAPTLWLEQDQFVLRKYRGASQITLKADDYAKYENGLWYPRGRTYEFGPYNVQVQTLQVRPLGKLPAGDNRFKAASLNPSRDALKLPEPDGLKEFYQRFR